MNKRQRSQAPAAGTDLLEILYPEYPPSILRLLCLLCKTASLEGLRTLARKAIKARGTEKRQSLTAGYDCMALCDLKS